MYVLILHQGESVTMSQARRICPRDCVRDKGEADGANHVRATSPWQGAPTLVPPLRSLQQLHPYR